MGRKKVGETPVYSYRIQPQIAERLDAVYRQLGKDWTAVFESLLTKWGEIPVLQKKVSVIQKYQNGEKEMMDVFYKINPTLKYGNKTHWKAVQILYNKLGKDKALRTAEAAVAAYGQQYAPTITTPTQLENKLSELVAFYRKQGGGNIVITDPNL